jgi:hypothetical protein
MAGDGPFGVGHNFFTITVNFIHKYRPIWMQNAHRMIRSEHFSSRLDETFCLMNEANSDGIFVL